MKTSITHAGDPPPHQSKGLDWNAIRKDYAEKATPEELDGPFDERGNLKGSRAEAINRAERFRGSRGAPPRRFDHGEAARLYADEKLKVRDIAERMGVSQTPIREALKAAGVYDPRRDVQKK